MKKLLMFSVPLALGSTILQAQPSSACCYGLLHTYGGCNYWELCVSNPPAVNSAPIYSAPTNTELPVTRTRYSDGTPYIRNGRFYPAQVVLFNSGQLNVFSGPGLQYAVVDTVDNNARLSITGEGVGQGQDRWVKLPNGNWINAIYLTPPLELSQTDPDREYIQNLISGTN